MEIGREGRSNLDLGARNVLHLAKFGEGLFRQVQMPWGGNRFGPLKGCDNRTGRLERPKENVVGEELGKVNGDHTMKFSWANEKNWFHSKCGGSLGVMRFDVFLSNSLWLQTEWYGWGGLAWMQRAQVRAWRSSVRASTLGTGSNGRLGRRGYIQDLPGKEHTQKDSVMTCSPLV